MEKEQVELNKSCGNPACCAKRMQPDFSGGGGGGGGNTNKKAQNKNHTQKTHPKSPTSIGM